MQTYAIANYFENIFCVTLNPILALGKRLYLKKNNFSRRVPDRLVHDVIRHLLLFLLYLPGWAFR